MTGERKKESREGRKVGRYGRVRCRRFSQNNSSATMNIMCITFKMELDPRQHDSVYELEDISPLHHCPQALSNYPVAVTCPSPCPSLCSYPSSALHHSRNLPPLLLDLLPNLLRDLFLPLPPLPLHRLSDRSQRPRSPHPQCSIIGPHWLGWRWGC